MLVYIPLNKLVKDLCFPIINCSVYVWRLKPIHVVDVKSGPDIQLPLKSETDQHTCPVVFGSI